MPARLERSNDAAIEARSIMHSRVFDAPRQLVWKAWTDAKHLSQWWGPDGFTITTSKFDFRPGGEWVFVMHGPDGTDYKNHLIYREIVEFDRILFSHVSGPVFDATATFVSEGNKTRVTMQMVFDSVELRNRVVEEFGAVEGLKQTLAHLGDYVGRMNSGAFVISRAFDAPRDLVWKAWTEEDRLAQWFGPKGTKVTHSNNDLRPGGMYLYCLRSADGSDMWGRWLYREIAKPERLVFIASFSNEKAEVTKTPFGDDWPLEWLSTITFAEEAGRTRVTVRWEPIHATEAQQLVFAAGHASMNNGWSGTFEHLATYLGR
jgi:uncharacterized protein YndB with AHSA1/START domain